MSELVNEECERQEKITIEKVAQQTQSRDAMKAERERLKQEALERSRQRREADQNYFLKKQESNQLYIQQKQHNSDSTFSSEGTNQGESVDGGELHVEAIKDPNQDPDPFRSFVDIRSNRIFIK